MLNGILRLVGQYLPQMYFGDSGVIALLGSIVIGVIVVQRYVSTLQLAVGCAMIMVLMAMAGLLMLNYIVQPTTF